MPRNNKNKNRNRGQPQAASAAAKTTSTIGSNELEEKAAIISAGIEAAENTKSALAEAKDKLEQLQKTVNSIQVNIIQSKEKSAENVDEAHPRDSSTPDEQKPDSAEAPFETQTMRKKRNRNRNKKKTGQSTSGDSGASSTAGTHESSPNVVATSIAQISEDKSRPSEHKIENLEQLPKEKEENDIKIENVELKTDEKPTKKTDEQNLISFENAIIIEEVASNIIETISTDLDQSKTIESTTRDAKKSPKTNKKQNQKGSNPTNKSNEPKKQVQVEKSEGKDTLKECDTVETTKSGDTQKAAPPQNVPLPKPIAMEEPIQKIEDLICVESKIEPTNPVETQPKPDLSQTQPAGSSETKKNQSPNETRNAKNNKKSPKNQQKTETKPEIKPETKQEEKKNPPKQKQQPETVQKTSPVNIIQETPKPTEIIASEKIVESKPIKDNVTEVEIMTDTAKSDEIITKEAKIEIIENPKESLSSIMVTEETVKQDLGRQNKEKIEMITSPPPPSSSSSVPDPSLPKTMPTAMPAPNAAKSVKHPAETDDESAKIWKILEEASKSLEPIEIQIEDDHANSTPKAEEPSVIASPIAITPSDEIEAKKAAHNLMALLDVKEPTTAKTKEIKPEDPKCMAAKKKEQSPMKSQPRQNSESANKKDNKSHSKNTKMGQKQAKIEAPPPIVEHTPVADTEIPLDMSIISATNIETSETVTNSKNVQGSDFVPSVEKTAVEMKSLGTENVTITPEPLECTDRESIDSAAKTVVNDSKQLPPKVEENPSKASKVKSNSPPKGKKSEQGNQKKIDNLVCKPAEKKPTEINTNTTGKKTSPQLKPAKPNVPPKPEHLVSSNAKKSTDQKPNPQEMKLVLAGMAEDDKDFEENYIEYKFMPRQVFIATICQSCKKSTTSDTRLYCEHCQMVSYCSKEHQATDNVLHKDFCAAIQEIAKKRGGHVYNNARILNNNDYRSLRVHTLNLCEDFLKRPLQTYEREILLFPRLCSMPICREWRQNQLSDCSNCTQVYYCTSNPDHLNETHQKWCKSVALYSKLVVTQSISGRIEPSLPSRILSKPYTLPHNIEQVFQDLYKNYSAIKDECVFATVTQLATAPLTAYFAAQQTELKIGEKFTIHLVGAELQFEADILDIWETFFLHLSHKLVELTIVFCGPELNAENIPLDIISRIRMCRTCRQNCRIVKFDFQCAKLYHDYANSGTYKAPDLICFFNPGFHHISYNGLDTWSETIKNAASAGCPVIVTSYTEYESPKDLERFQMEMTKINKPMTLIHGPQLNAYASQRPERNFISDEVTPLIFKNFFCFIMK